jgi:kynureninase
LDQRGAACDRRAVTTEESAAGKSAAGESSWSDRAAALDEADPLGWMRARFLAVPEVVAYLDGNSLGRPLDRTPSALADFVRDRWGGRLIRGWDEGWMEEPQRLGDELGRVVLGAAPGQTVVGDSTSVLLYKAVRAAIGLDPTRTGIVFAANDFPTDRFLLQGIARELGMTLQPMSPPHDGGIAAEQVAAAVGPRTAVVLLSHVAYRSAYITDIAAVTAAAHDAGAVVVWDLSHSAGVVPLELDAWGVDLAVGCGYKYLNGGPGAPAFLFARHELLARLEPPIQGWMGAAEPFAMGERYVPDAGVRRFLSGTPSILAMQPMSDMLALLDEAGIAAVRAKSTALTAFTIDWFDAELAPLGVRLATPRDADRRGSHVTFDHPAFESMLPGLHARGVIPDFRRPDGLRIGLSPLSTSFTELERGLTAVREELTRVE